MDTRMLVMIRMVPNRCHHYDEDDDVDDDGDDGCIGGGVRSDKTTAAKATSVFKSSSLFFCSYKHLFLAVMLLSLQN